MVTNPVISEYNDLLGESLLNHYDILSVLESKFIIERHKAKRVLIKGAWGIGKTYSLDKFIKKIEEENYIKVAGDPGIAGIIKVSLFGIQSIEALERKMKVAYTKANSLIGKVIESTVNVVNKKYAGGAIDPFSFVTIPKNYIIVFDDLERKSDKLSIKDILGFVEETALKCGVIVIVNEDAIDKKDLEDYRTYKEKIIEFEYLLNEISPTILEEIIDDNLNITEDNKKNIHHLFSKFGESNLRTLFKIKNFIDNLSFTISTPLNAELIKLCIAVIIEEYSSKKVENSDQRNPILKFKEYDINISAINLLEEVRSFLHQNIINKEKILDFLNPSQVESEDLLEKFNDMYLLNDSELIETVDRTINLFKTQNPKIKSVENHLALVGYVKYYIHKYNLSNFAK